VAQVSEVLDSTDPRLKIEVDDETDRVVVKVIKEESGEVIRQFPPEELLELEKFLSGSKGLLLQERA
jgi:flagellar protein FlaG